MKYEKSIYCSVLMIKDFILLNSCFTSKKSSRFDCHYNKNDNTKNKNELKAYLLVYKISAFCRIRKCLKQSNSSLLTMFLSLSFCVFLRYKKCSILL